MRSCSGYARTSGILAQSHRWLGQMWLGLIETRPGSGLAGGDTGGGDGGCGSSSGDRQEYERSLLPRILKRSS